MAWAQQLGRPGICWELNALCLEGEQLRAQGLHLACFHQGGHLAQGVCASNSLLVAVRLVSAVVQRDIGDRRRLHSSTTVSRFVTAMECRTKMRRARRGMSGTERAPQAYCVAQKLLNGILVQAICCFPPIRGWVLCKVL